VTRRDCRQVVTPGAGPIRWIRAKWATMGSAALAVTVMLISAMLAACTGAGTGPAGGGPAARLDPAQPAPAEADAPEAAGSPACTVSVRTPSGQALRLEVAADPVSRARGLGGRDGLEPGTAMALVFPEPTYVTIWMKDMRFDIDVVWIDGERVVDVYPRMPAPAPGTPDEDLASHTGREPADVVLELEAGTADDLGLKPGAHVQWEPGSPVHLCRPTARDRWG